MKNQNGDEVAGVQPERRCGVKQLIIKENVIIGISAAGFIALIITVWGLATSFTRFMDANAGLVAAVDKLQKEVQSFSEKLDGKVTRLEMDIAMRAALSKRYTTAHFEATGTLFRERNTNIYFPSADEVQRRVDMFSTVEIPK